jgi:hypothetical protein
VGVSEEAGCPVCTRELAKVIGELAEEGNKRFTRPAHEKEENEEEEEQVSEEEEEESDPEFEEAVLKSKQRMKTNMDDAESKKRKHQKGSLPKKPGVQPRRNKMN